LINKKGNHDIDQDELRNILDEVGNSLIVAGSSKKTKIHIHTNDPKKIFEICRQYGAVTGEKADDMIHQQKSFAERETTVAILTDSSADLPEEVISSLNIHVVPILINVGADTYIDKVSITSEEFHHLIKTQKAHPTTSQPSFGDFHRQYQYLSTHYDSIIAIHIPDKLSGTFSASKKAADKIADKADITVLDANIAGPGQGLIAMRAAEAAQAGLSKEKIIEIVNETTPNTQFFFVVTDLNFVAKGGRIPEKITKLFKLFKMSPVLNFNADGKIKPAGFLFGKNNLTEKIFKITKKKVQKDKKYRMIISYTGSKHKALQLEKLIKANMAEQLEQVFILPLGASLTAHGGLNALGVAMQVIAPFENADADLK